MKTVVGYALGWKSIIDGKFGRDVPYPYLGPDGWDNKRHVFATREEAKAVQGVDADEDGSSVILRVTRRRK